MELSTQVACGSHAQETRRTHTSRMHGKHMGQCYLKELSSVFPINTTKDFFNSLKVLSKF